MIHPYLNYFRAHSRGAINSKPSEHFLQSRIDVNCRLYCWLMVNMRTMTVIECVSKADYYKFSAFDFTMIVVTTYCPN